MLGLEEGLVMVLVLVLVLLLLVLQPVLLLFHGHSFDGAAGAAYALETLVLLPLPTLLPELLQPPVVKLLA